MLVQSDLPKSLWSEAVRHANWLSNRTTTVNTPDSTPYEKAHPTHQKPNIFNLPVFGSECWVKVETASKLDPRGTRACWVGVDDESKAHRIWLPGSHRIAIERDVVFPKRSATVEGELDDIAPDAPETPAARGDRAAPAPDAERAEDAAEDAVDPENVEGESEVEVGIEQNLSAAKESVIDPPAPLQPVVGRTSGRERKPSQWIRDIQSGTGSAGGRGAQKVPESVVNTGIRPLVPDAPAEAAKGAVSELEPTEEEEETLGPLYAYAAMAGDSPSQREALYGPERELWAEPMKAELSMLETMQTWELVPRPQHANVIPSQWVLLKKRDQQNEIRKLKARLVAGGHKQIFGVDFDNTSSPTVRLDTLRLLMALAAEHDWEIDVIDFTSAYLNGELPDDKPVYMQQPPGFEVAEKCEYVLKLKKAIYGLKNAGYHWYNTLRSLLLSIGLNQSISDPAVFFYTEPGCVIIVATHVDDCACLASGVELMTGLKSQISAQYNIVDLGPIRFMLGFEYTRDRVARTISMAQSVYIDTMLDRFRTTNANPLSLPLNLSGRRRGTRDWKSGCPTMSEYTVPTRWTLRKHKHKRSGRSGGERSGGKWRKKAGQEER